jgi:hypothetical protein
VVGLGYLNAQFCGLGHPPAIGTMFTVGSFLPTVDQPPFVLN